MTIFRIRHELKGMHVHVQVFAGKGPGCLGCAGGLVFRQEEFEDFRQLLESQGVMFVEKEKEA